LVRAAVVDPAAQVLLHPHASPAGAAAKAAHPVALHLAQLELRDGRQDFARRRIDPIPPPEIARVVVGDGGRQRLLRLEAPPGHQVGQELGVVDHGVAPAELRILVGQGVEAVRARHDHFAPGMAVQRRNAGLRLLLEQILVADAAGRIAVARFGGPQNGEVDLSPLQQPDQRPRHPAVGVVVGGGAAGEVNVLGLRVVRQAAQAQALRPIGTLALR
jgi:hypothetical protein